MAKRNEEDTLTEVVETLTAAGDESETSVGDIVEAVGQKGFGKILLVPGLIVLSPISGIPGVPTLGAIAVFLISVQMLIGRDCIWLPGFITRQTISRKRMDQAQRFMTPVSQVVDKVVWPRLTVLTRPPFTYGIALACLAIALIMPLMEVVMFSSIIAATPITAFGLALTADDGLLALIAFTLTLGSFYLAYTLLM
jgi:hypothetical protein